MPTKTCMWHALEISSIHLCLYQNKKNPVNCFYISYSSKIIKRQFHTCALIHIMNQAWWACSPPKLLFVLTEWLWLVNSSTLLIDPKLKITETILQHHFIMLTVIHITINQKHDFIFYANAKTCYVTSKHKVYSIQITHYVYWKYSNCIYNSLSTCARTSMMCIRSHIECSSPILLTFMPECNSSTLQLNQS